MQHRQKAQIAAVAMGTAGDFLQGLRESLQQFATQALLSTAGIDLPAALKGRSGPGPNTRRTLPAQRRPRRTRKADVDTDGSLKAVP